MKFYQPIEGLLERRRRGRRGRVTFGLFGALGVCLVVGWALFASTDRAAEARTDRILSLSSPDFTEVLSDGESGSPAAPDARAQGDLAHALVHPPEFAQGDIRRNQTLFVAMRQSGADSASIQAVVESLAGVYDFRRAQPGDHWEAHLDDDGRVVSFRYTVSPEEVYEATRDPDGSYHSGRVDIPTETVVVALGGTVTGSVYRSVAQLGEETSLASRFLEVFGWDFDFSRDGRPGDTFKMVVEKVLLDGQLLRYGHVLAAEYHSASTTLRAFAHTDASGRVGYYTADGESLRRTYLRAPLQYRRITSTFTHRRYHPILHVYRPHLGVDYAADVGTPVWAIADGEVTFAGYRGGNGNLVVVQHADGVESLYAHLSAYGDGIRHGRQVQQGDVIGYVGSTGLSTGPHLHFAVRINGDYVDPLSLQATRGPSLRGDELTAFRQSVEQLSAQLDGIALAPVDLSQVQDSGESEGSDDLPNDFGVIGADDGDQPDETPQDDE